VDLGAGARIGIGEPTYPIVVVRIRVPTSPSTSVSLRPSVTFGNNNSKGERNNQTQIMVPLTLDALTNRRVSVYLGPGLTYNVDSDRQTNPSIHAGVDIKLNQRVRLSAGLNYVFQRNDADNRDLEANALLYFAL
jgi:Outer membrane protein beta-barrel domain